MSEPLLPALDNPVPEPPPWADYEPARGPGGAIVLDLEREHRLGVKCASLGERLRRTGCEEAALNTILRLMQDRMAPAKVQLEAARTILNYSQGTPATGQRVTESRTLIIMDGRPSVAGPALTVAREIVERDDPGATWEIIDES